MATKKQKDELLATLKFTPIDVNIQVYAYGGECYMGKVDRKIYEYFKEHKIDMEEYATDWDGKFDFVPSEMQPFPPGSPYECDGMCHASGPELSNNNRIEVTGPDNDTIWECDFGLNELEDQGVEIDEWETAIIDDEPEGTVVFWGGQGEKGTCFGATFELRAPFDPKKLKISYSNCDGWWICNGISYDDEDLDNNDLSTTGKWGENKWVIVGDEEVYESVSRDDIDEDEVAHETGTDNPVDFPAVSEEWDPESELEKIFEEHLLTEWFPIDVKPVRKGMYECEVEIVTWPWPAVSKYEWSGKSWKDSNGKKVTGLKQWRGLNVDPAKLEINDE